MIKAPVSAERRKRRVEFDVAREQKRRDGLASISRDPVNRALHEHYIDGLSRSKYVPHEGKKQRGVPPCTP